MNTVPKTSSVQLDLTISIYILRKPRFY